MVSTTSESTWWRRRCTSGHALCARKNYPGGLGGVQVFSYTWFATMTAPPTISMSDNMFVAGQP
eukprot:12885617-Prorocentrum_lima.AAC.1